MAEKKKRGLGKGLDSLIPANASGNSVSVKKADVSRENASDKEREIEGVGIVKMVRIAQIEPDRQQPRKNFDKDKLLELAQSIKDHGLLEPLLVQKENGRYILIAGERRWRAAKQAGLKEVPVIIKDYDSAQKAVVALIDNIQREALNPIEEADAYNKLIEEYGLTQEELAAKLGKSRTAITNTLRLLKLTQEVRKMVASGELSMGQARALIPVEDEKLQIALAERIIKEDLSVREVEKLIRNLNSKSENKEKKKDESLEQILRDLESRMNQALGMKVEIRSNGNKGKLQISYESQSDLEKLMDLLM